MPKWTPRTLKKSKKANEQWGGGFEPGIPYRLTPLGRLPMLKFHPFLS